MEYALCKLVKIFEILQQFVGNNCIFQGNGSKNLKNPCPAKNLAFSLGRAMLCTPRGMRQRKPNGNPGIERITHGPSDLGEWQPGWYPMSPGGNAWRRHLDNCIEMLTISNEVQRGTTMNKDIDLRQKLTLSVPEAAAMLGISTKVAYTLARRADFPSFKVSPNRVVVSRVGLETWVQQQLDAKGGQ